MTGFDLVARLAQECFKHDVGHNGEVRIKKNYIALVTSKEGDVCTDIFYDPKEKSVTIVTFNSPAVTEEIFSEYLKGVGVESTIEKKMKPFVLPGLGDAVRSPSGKAVGYV
jgi:hypothetical protein